MEKEKVIVFSTPTCPWCIQAKSYLKEKNIPFKDIDVSEDSEWANKMFEKSHQMGVPQLWINDDVVVGFDVPEINRLLKIK